MSINKALIARVLAGERAVVARVMSLLEDRHDSAGETLSQLYPYTGRAHTIGVTGPPGAGKSTLILGLVKEFRKRDKRVGVVAVDPTSTISGGALLGDRVRMQELSGDPQVFIRSMATRGHLGGLALATADMVKVLDAAGYDLVFIETVGSGQAEVEIASEAHTTMVVEAPGLGDEIQALKSGISEVGDIFVVNKADREGADAAVSALRYMLKTSESAPEKWQPPVLKTVALKEQGVSEVAEAIAEHLVYLKKTSEWEMRNRKRSEQEVMRILGAEVLSRVRSRLSGGAWEELLQMVSARRIDPYQAARSLLDDPTLWQMEKSQRIGTARR